MDEHQSILVTYTYHLPEHEEELRLVNKADDLQGALYDIYNACRSKWKYEAGVSDETIEFAEKIAEMCRDAEESL